MSQSNHIPYLNDSWTPSVQALGYQHLRDQLVEVARKADPPFAAAVCGGWGSGKTSLLRSVMNQLGGDLIQLTPEETLAVTKEVPEFIFDRWEKEKGKEEDNIRTVWFNPWQHQFEGHPLIALLHEIRNQFSWRLKAKKKVGKVTYIALKNGLRLMDDLIGSVTKTLTGHKLQFGVEKIEASGVAFEKERYLNKLDSQRFQLHFEAAVAHLISDGASANKTGRLVIFIDDLDRCESQQALKLLEAIKLYLATPRCVFLLGLDTEHTEEALVSAGLKDIPQARQYLHKLFQMTLHLPRSRRFQTFIKEYIQELNGNNEVFVFGESHTELDQLTEMLCRILEGNPRRIKNFLNLLFFKGRTFRATHHQKTPDPQTMALLCALQYHYPKIYRLLEEDPLSLTDITTGLAITHLKSAPPGRIGFVARESNLPQTEVKVEDFEPSVLDGPHHTDSRALFVVQAAFKDSFAKNMNPIAITPVELEPYLQP